MHIEIDQSGRIEFTGTDTVLAYSNNEQYAILIPSIVKREIVRNYRRKYKSSKIFFTKLFAACVFLLIKNAIKNFDEIIVDVEYWGREKEIKNILINYIRKIYPNFDKHLILFRRITKKSNAHKVAISVFRNNRAEDRVIKIEELEELL